MATRINAGTVSRGEVFKILPDNLIFDEKHNSRVVPHTDEEIEALARSIFENGQVQPILARKVEDDRVQVVAGFGRCRAVAYINKHFKPEQPFRVLVRVADINEEEAFVQSIIENEDRVSTTPIDQAHAQRRLRESFGWSEERIAEFYKKSVSYIGQLRKMLGLSAPLKEEVAKGNMPVATAVLVTSLPEAEREEVVAEAKKDDGKVDSEVVKKKVREKRIASGTDKVTALSVREIRKFLEEQTGPAERKSSRLLCEMFLEFIAGKKTEQQMSNALARYTVPDTK